MAIWGHRDSEPPAEEAHETRPPASPDLSEAPAGPEDQGGGSADELAPAFWRAQGEAPAAAGRAPGDAPPLEYGHVPPEATERAEAMEPGEAPEPAYGQQAPAGSPAPAMDESPAGTDAPAPVLAEEIVVIDAETAVKDPALAETGQDPATADAGLDPEAGLDQEATRDLAAGQVAGEPPVAQEPPAAAAAPASPAGVSPQRWNEIMATFVDDPRGSVKMAADAVDSAIEEFVNSVRDRQRALASSWQGGDTDTEQLRTSLREYRRFAAQVRQMSPSEETGAPASTAGG